MPTLVPTVPRTRFRVGERVKAGDPVVSMERVMIAPPTAVFWPAPGRVWLVVTAGFENTGRAAVTISALAQMELCDANGQAYSLDLTATTPGGVKPPDGEIYPGDTRRDPLGYQIPADARGLQWIYNGPGGRRVIFDVPDLDKLR
jgi:hypothetical protein